MAWSRFRACLRSMMDKWTCHVVSMSQLEYSTPHQHLHARIFVLLLISQWAAHRYSKGQALILPSSWAPAGMCGWNHAKVDVSELNSQVGTGARQHDDVAFGSSGSLIAITFPTWLQQPSFSSGRSLYEVIWYSVRGARACVFKYVAVHNRDRACHVGREFRWHGRWWLLWFALNCHFSFDQCRKLQNHLSRRGRTRYEGKCAASLFQAYGTTIETNYPYIFMCSTIL